MKNRTMSTSQGTSGRLLAMQHDNVKGTRVTGPGERKTGVSVKRLANGGHLCVKNVSAPSQRVVHGGLLRRALISSLHLHLLSIPPASFLMHSQQGRIINQRGPPRGPRHTYEYVRDSKCGSWPRLRQANATLIEHPRFPAHPCRA